MPDLTKMQAQDTSIRDSGEVYGVTFLSRRRMTTLR